MHFRTQLHRALLDGHGRPRRELSERDMMQALVLLLRYSLSALTCPLCMVNVEDECVKQATASVSQAGNTSHPCALGWLPPPYT